MKKKIFLVLTLILAALLLASCGKDSTTYYTVSFDSDGSKDYQDRAIEEGETIENEPIPTRVGYEFLGWYNGDVKWDFEKDEVTSDLILTAKWKRLSFTVKFETNGGSYVESQIINFADKVVRPQDPTKENYVFAGWLKEDGSEWNFSFDRVTDYLTLYAKWESRPTFTVTFNSNGGTATPSQYVVDGGKVSVPAAPTKENNAFLGWYNGDAKWDFDKNVVNGNITLVAKWQATKTYTVTFDSNGGSAVPPQYVAVGGKAVKPSTPDGQMFSIFVGWFYGNTEWNFDTVITSDIKLTAKWINHYKISFDTAGAEKQIPSFYVAEGGLISKPEEPTKANSQFVGWYFGNKLWDFDSDKVTSNITLTAKWKSVATYTVTFDSNGGTETSKQHVIKGGYITEPGTKREGFRFDGWYLGDDKWNFAEDTVSKSITLKAKWIEIVTVTFNIDGKTTTETLDKGQKLPKPEEDPKKTGYLFRGWLIDGTNTEWNFENAVNESMTLKANFKIAFTVTFDTDGGTAVPPLTLAEGDLIPKKDTSKSNHRFDGWYISGTSIKWNFDADRVTENIVLKAKWIPSLPPDIWTD